MIKNPVTLVVAMLASITVIVAAALTPVSASSSYSTSSYFPDQFVNQGKEFEPAVDTDGDTGLPKAFPKQSVDSFFDATPEMYS